MLSASVPLTDKLKTALDINSSVRLISEWNHNRFTQVTSVTNLGVNAEDEYDNDLFPLSSIALPDRPTKGIVRGWVYQGTGAIMGRTSSGYQDSTTGARYTTASADNKYKYYVSPLVSAASSPYAIANVNPTVLYATPAWSNKIYVALENSDASPTTYSIAVTTDGTTWTTVSTNPAIASDGTIQIYRQADGSWSTTVYRDNPVQLRGVRLTVSNMNAGSSRFSLIELGARLENDLSTYVMTYNVDNTMSEHSFIAPIGRASSNTGGVTLDNTGGVFTNDNPSSLYYNLLDKNVDLRLDIGINIGTYAAPNFEWIRQFTMRSDSWSGQDRETTEIELVDASVYLQSVNPNPCFYQQMTVGEIIWRLLDSVGFSAWKYDPRDDDPSTLVPQFWANGEQSVWEVIANLAEATQTAIFFDQYGVLQIKTKAAAYDIASTPVWNLDEIKNGTKQPDIVELDKTYDYEANVVNVVYKPTALNETLESGVEVMESVWEPEETLTLRSSQLKQSMTAASTSMVITPSEVVYWPYTGIVQIEGEFIRYIKKGYSYRAANGTWTNVYISSNDEKIALDKKNPALAYQNYFNGFLWIGDITANRGLWNTTAAAHSVDASGYTGRYRHYPSAVKAWGGGFILNKYASTVTMKTNSTFGRNSWYAVTRGSSNDSPPYWYGTRLKFDTSGYTYGAAGLVISAGTNDSGYYVELIKTSALTATDRAQFTHELCFYVKYVDGTIKRMGPNGGKGIPIAISAGVWYDLDVHFEWQGSNRIISVMVNGVTKLSASVPSAQGTGESIGGRYGMFTRGFTSVQYEYLYASTYAVNDTFDDEGWWDRIKGGYQSGQWDKEWVYGYRTNTKVRWGKSTKVKARYASRLFDDFGPIVHEVREFDVNFSKTPVTFSNLYFSNESQVICPEYNSTPFGAKFVLANTSRDNAVVYGEDTLMFGSDNAVDQKILIYGKTFKQDEDKTYTVRDSLGVKRRGEVPLEVNNEWIQSEAAAKSLGDWIIKNWSGGADEVEVKMFGNPLLQLTDMISVNAPSRYMATATHKYFVVKVSHNYNNGLETSLTLRRAKI